jgi:hypothetical protein
MQHLLFTLFRTITLVHERKQQFAISELLLF